jgi:ribosomal protein S18 acetylase RimI-like enzyme
VITYGTIPKDDIRAVKPLWEELNRLHLARSTNFKGHVGRNTFERRIEKVVRLPEDRLHIRAAREGDKIVGYVIATVSDDGTGEVDSIFVAEDRRTDGVGTALMEGALAWLTGRGCAHVVVGVAEGNEEAFGFYRRFGFVPRMTILARAGEEEGAPGGVR